MALQGGAHINPHWHLSTKYQNQGLVRDVRALLRNCIFGITPDRDGM